MVVCRYTIFSISPHFLAHAPYTVVDFRNNKSYIIFISKYIFYKYKINGSDFLGDTKGCVMRIIKFTTGCSDPNLYCPYIIFYVPRPTTCPFLKEIWQTTALEITILQVVISKTQWEYLSEAKNHFYCPFLSLKRKKKREKSS